MLHTIWDNIAETDRPIMKIIFRNNNTRVIAFGLKKGMKLTDHQLPVNTKIILMKGEVEIESKIETVTLSDFDEYEIAPKVIHQVTAKNDLMMLVILNFNEKSF